MLPFYKEGGASSNRALQEVRRLLGGGKAGHAGTLDPEARGLLLVCLGEGTKLVPFLAPLEKEYVAEMSFGVETDSHDVWGAEIGRAPVPVLALGEIQEHMNSFLGLSDQIPPMFSAIKVGGERLYRMARRGESVFRPPRPVRVTEFLVLRWETPRLRFRVRCGSGTYVRTLCHDLAKGCGSAGHMTALERTAVGPFRSRGAPTVTRIGEILRSGAEGLPLVSLVNAIPHLPLIPLTAEEARRVRQGLLPSPLPGEIAEDLTPGQDLRFVGPGGDLVAVVSCPLTGGAPVVRRVFAPPSGESGISVVIS